MNIEIWGVGFSNKGAELMLSAIIRTLSRFSEDINFVIGNAYGTYLQKAKYGLYQKVNTLDYEESNFKAIELIPWRIRKKLGLVTEIDVKRLLDQYRKNHGIVTEDEIQVVLNSVGFAYGDEWGPEKTERMANLTERWRSQGKKIIFLPQAFGPFRTPRIQKEFQKILKSVDLVYARDTLSYEYLEELDASIDHVRIAPDFTNLVEGQLPDYFRSKSKQACVIPNQKMFQMTSKEIRESYIPFLVFCIRYLINNNISTSVLLHDTHLDSEFISLLKPEFRNQLRIIKESDPILIKGILGSCHVVIGSRYHSLVGALSQGVPCLGTGWSHKYRTLFEDYSCPEYLINALDSYDEISEKLNYAINDPSRSILVKNLISKSKIHKVRTANMWSEIRKLLFP